MKLARMVSRFYTLVDDDAQDIWTRDRVIGLLNSGVSEVARTIQDQDSDYFLKCLSVTVTAAPNGERIIELPEDFMSVLLAERVSNSANNPVPAQWVDWSKRHLDPYGSPVARSSGDYAPLLSLKGRHIVVINPGSAFTLQVWYTFVLPELETDDDTPDAIPGYFHDLIVLHAAKLAAGIERKAFAFDEEYNRQLAAVAVMGRKRQRQSARYVHTAE